MQVFNTVRLMTNWIKETLIAKALSALEDFVNPESTHSFGPSEILGRIREALMRFWEEMALEMMANKRGDDNAFYLVLSRLSYEWSKGVIESVFSMYNERLFMKAGDGAVGLSDLEINRSAVEVSTTFRNLSQKLLSRYAQVQVGCFTYKIREHVQYPLLGDQVVIQSAVWKAIANDMEEINNQVKSSFKDETKSTKAVAGKLGAQDPYRARQPAKKHGTNAHTLKLDNILDTLDSLFDERLVYLPQMIELKLPTVMAVISKCVLKVSIF